MCFEWVKCYSETAARYQLGSQFPAPQIGLLLAAVVGMVVDHQYLFLAPGFFTE